MRRLARATVLAALGAASTGCPRLPPYGLDGGPVDGPAGKVTFSLVGGAGQPPLYSVTACFWNGPPPTLDADGGTTCRGSWTAGCCVSGADPGLAGQSCAEASVDVGPVRLLDNGAPLGTLGLDGGSYALEDAGPLAWKAGDQLEIQGGGQNGFPAFDVSVAAPAPPVPTQPAQTPGGSVPVDRAHGLEVDWPSGRGLGSDGWIAATDPATGALESAECRSPGDPGLLRFPGAALQLLPVGVGTGAVARVNQTLSASVEAVARGTTEIAVETQ